jgi:dTDP-4-amino-4,6-dideoxygalactose transaminase
MTSLHLREDKLEEMLVPLIDLVAQYRSIQPEVDAAISEVLTSGQFILGAEVKTFEDEMSSYLGVKFAVGVASGTDALIISLRAMGIGTNDEVILPAYTFFATVGAVLHLGATPVFVDIDPNTYCLRNDQVREKITQATKAIIPVHLFGHPADMTPLVELSQDYGVKIIEDNAQALGAEYQAKKTGCLGDVACLSFFPSKNLGAYGDGGMVVTNDPLIAEKARVLRTHGWKDKYFPEILGYNSRLDALQAAILRVKLRHIDNWNANRQEIASYYNRELKDLPDFKVPFEAPEVKHIYHLYIIQSSQRDLIQGELKKAGVSTGIYYPQSLHLTQPCRNYGYKVGDFPISEKASRETLAIPIFPEMTPEQIEIVVGTLNTISS